ncbi:hypothetical protein OEZ86_009526 [Tetradesmus obliquus]|uniref:Solute carrier family 40 protein n=1 Tax=Tetradesmus obliquus TaxID=3088 RepID=A0ABY8UQ74_TETOB|nr:hypothetical protein OEZ85_000972 [Tetradesmus obliquus]WIA42989.1 hypothetical protein OEZ86_009526 [Tetradesmus obliquus]
MFSSRERTRSSTSQDYSFVYFFLIAVAYKVPWTAISSLLGQLSVQFQQPSILLWLNLAYFLPSLPALLLHSSLQEKLEQRMGLPRAAMARFVFGLGGLVLLCLALPYCCGSITALLAATAAVGVCYSIAFGTSYQLVTHFPPGCTVALTTGFVSCGVVVLAADLLLKRGPYYSAAGMARLFQVVALQTCLGLAAAAAVLRRNWKRLAAAGPPSMYTSSSSSSRGLHRPDLGFGQPGTSDKHIIGGAFGERLPQVLFYARLAGDICGRLAPHWLHLRSSAAVLAAGAAKAALLALLVPAMLRPQLVGGDTQLALLIAANWWMSGYINTGAYLLAPKLAAQAAAAGRFQRPGSSSSKGSGGGGSASVKARAGGIMALAFQMSCFAGLLGAWALQSWALAGWAQPLQESGVRFPASRAGDGQDQVLGDLAAAAAVAAAHAADVHVAGVGSAALSQAGTAAAAAAAGSGSGG